jgi:hypothetical protein
VLRKFIKLDHRAVDVLLLQPVPRLGGVAGGDGGESQARQPSVSRRATALPMAPSPAMAMRVEIMGTSAFRHTWHGAARQDGLSPARHATGARLDRCGSLGEGRPNKSGGNEMLKTITGALAAVAALTAGASAQNYPTRPVTMVIPFAAGGPTDVLGRVVGARMAEILGQQVVIENVGGAGGMTGSKRVADAQPDGYIMGSAPSAPTPRVRRSTGGRSTIRRPTSPLWPCWPRFRSC